MRPISIERLEVEVLAEYEPPLAAAATLRGMVQTFREIKTLVDPADPTKRLVTRTSHLRRPVVAAWIKAYPGRSPARVESLLRNWRIIVNYAVESGYLTTSPFASKKINHWVRADAVKARPRQRLYRTADEIRAFLRQLELEKNQSWSTLRLWALGHVYIYTGFRKNEALHLLTRNVDLRREVITIEPLPELGWTPKTVKSSRTVPLAKKVTDVLREYTATLDDPWENPDACPWLFPGTHRVGPWTGGSKGYTPLEQIKAVARRAGLPEGMTILGARKSVGTNAKAMGMGGLERKLIFGHTEEETGDRYDEEQIETLRPAIKKLELFYGPSGDLAREVG